MLIRSLCFAAVLVASPAVAQTEAASRETIAAETRFYLDLDGPEPGDKRPIAIWRAPNTPTEQQLPTLYMPDSDIGLYVAAAYLRPLILAGVLPPIQILGLNPDRNTRVYNYQGDRERLRTHERWLVETVIPWAEHNLGASPQHRVIAGFSNGGDFSLFVAQDYPEMFQGVVAFSPVFIGERFALDERAAHVRWALSAGRTEYRGGALRSINVVRAAARGQGAAVRMCVGPWQHEVSDWREVAPGAVAWAFGFENAGVAWTSVERDACHVEAAH